MGNFTNVSMGTGAPKVNDVDVGFLKGVVEYKFNYDIQDFETGVPFMLQGRQTKKVSAELTTPLANSQRQILP